MSLQNSSLVTVHGSAPSSPPYQQSSSSSSTMNDPLLKSSSTMKKKRLISGSLLPNFIIPSPYSRKNKILVSLSALSVIIFASTIAAVLSLLLNRHAMFGGMRLYAYFFVISGVVAGFVLLMFGITIIMRLLSRASKRFSYFVSPFTGPLYIFIWAGFCFEFLPIIVPEIQDPSEPTRVLRECIRIAASCSVVSAAGTILLIVMERIVYGELQERLWNVLWSERCVAIVAMENNTASIDAITHAARPENVLSLAHKVRDKTHGLSKWLGLEDLDPKDDHSISRCAANIANMIMRRRDVGSRGCLYPSDIVLPQLRSKDSANLFRVFDLNRQGSASPEEVKSAIELILLEKKSVIELCSSRSMIVDVVHQIIRGFVTTVIVVIIIVILLEVNVYTLLVGLGTTFIGLGFALNTTIQGLLESLQMIFFVRPFEIGDLVRIDDGPALQVEKVNIISTMFYTMDGYAIYYHNATLARSRISNWKRSKDVTFDVPLYLSMETNAEHLAALKHKVQTYMDGNQQYSPKFTMLVSEFNKVYMVVILKVTLKTIWQERMVWMRYASDLRIFASQQVVEMGIQYQRSEIFKNVPWEPHTMI